MNRLALELDEKLRTLDPTDAQQLESLVRRALDQANNNDLEAPSPWPVDYFANTAGALAGEEFERAPQGELPIRERW